MDAVGGVGVGIAQVDAGGVAPGLVQREQAHVGRAVAGTFKAAPAGQLGEVGLQGRQLVVAQQVHPGAVAAGQCPVHRGLDRSEEHTSELQSLMRISYAVFCFKKKKNKINNIIYIYTCLVGGIQRDRNTSLYNIYHYKYLNKPSTQTILCHIYIPNTSLIRPLYHKTRRLCTNT